MIELNSSYIYDIHDTSEEELNKIKEHYNVKDLGGYYLQYTFQYGWAIMKTKPEINILRKVQ